jgi:hypothetical protein
MGQIGRTILCAIPRSGFLRHTQERVDVILSVCPLVYGSAEGWVGRLPELSATGFRLAPTRRQLALSNLPRR